MKRTIVIGDVHGCWDELRDLLDRVGPSEGDLVLSVGDLVDRGPASADVVAWFRAQPNAKVLMGNHERKHVRGVFSYAQEITRLELGAAYEDAVVWMRGLPYFHEDEAIRVVHAAMIPGVPLAEQREEILCGSTSGAQALERILGPERFWHELYEDEKPVVFGHHVVGKEPLVVRDRVFGLDTGACHGWALTALVVPEFRLVSVPARADHWARVKREKQVPVLEAKPWATMTFDAIEDALAAIRTDDASTRDWIQAKRAWARTLADRRPSLLAAVHAEARRLEGDGFADAARAHPAGSLLFQARAGRLTLATIASRACTPERVLELASALDA